MTEDKALNPVEIYSGTMWQTGIVKSLLENAEIETFLEDTIMGTLNPWWTSPGGSAPIRVFVAGEKVDQALEVVKAFETSQLLENESN